MASEQDILETVDEAADRLDPVAVEAEAERLGLSVDAFLARVITELKARL